MGGVQTVKLTLRNTQQLAAKLINDGEGRREEVMMLMFAFRYNKDTRSPFS